MFKIHNISGAGDAAQGESASMYKVPSLIPHATEKNPASRSKSRVPFQDASVVSVRRPYMVVSEYETKLGIQRQSSTASIQLCHFAPGRLTTNPLDISSESLGVFVPKQETGQRWVDANRMKDLIKRECTSKRRRQQSWEQDQWPPRYTDWSGYRQLICLSQALFLYALLKY